MNYWKKQNKNNTGKLFLIAIFLLLAWKKEDRKIHLFLAGDSTMSIKDIKAFPETGWGMPFVYFWDTEKVEVVNKAKNGRSTKSFREEGLWDQILKEAAPGDYVFIQFGHNDEVPTKKTYTTETEFSENLHRFVKEARELKLNPILLTPVARRKFDANGNIEETHEVYSALLRTVAKKDEVVLIEADRKTQQLYQEMGVENSKLLFLQLKAGEHPNYLDGKEDNTHFSELGARLVAQLILKELRLKAPELTALLVQPKK